jgi:hypothetical protein
VKFQEPSVLKNKRIILGFILACSSLIMFSCPLAIAAESSLFSGGDIDTRGQGFAYLGLDVTQKVYENLSISGRVIPNYLTYKFRSGDDTVRANSSGIYTVAGIKLSFSQTTLGLFGGVEYRNTNLSPDVRSADVRGIPFQVWSRANLTAGFLEGRTLTFSAASVERTVFFTRGEE